MQDGNSTEPGWVFRPGDQPQQSVQEAPEPVAQPTPAPVAETPVTSDLTETTTPVNQAPAVPEPAEVSAPVSGDALAEWTASEYIASPKNAGWFALLAVTSIFVAAVVFVVTRDMVSTVVTLVLGLLLGIFAARQPRTLQYRIDRTGIQVGSRLYEYKSFKAFSIDHEHAIGHISLTPLKRFMPPLSIHYDPQDENRIADALAGFLPYEEHRVDMVDNLTRRLRF